MVTAQLIAFIKEQQHTGRTQEEITELLRQNGWQPADIAAGFHQVATGAPSPTSPVPTDRLMDIMDLLKASWNIFAQRWRTFVVILIIQSIAGIGLFVLFLAGGLATFLTSGMGLANPSDAPDMKLSVVGAGLALLLIGIVVVCLFSFLSNIAMYHVIRSESIVGVKSAYGYAWSKFGSFLWVAVLSSLAIMGGMMLLFVPGIIASVALSFTIFVLMTEEIGGYGALVRSWQYVHGHWWAVVWRFIALSFVVGIISSILGAISMGALSLLVSVIITPITATYTYVLFKNLKSLPRDPQALSRPNGYYKVYAIVGLIWPAIFILITILSLSLFRN